MDTQYAQQVLTDLGAQIVATLLAVETYLQLALAVVIFGVAYLVASRIRQFVPALVATAPQAAETSRRVFSPKLGNLLFPVLAIFLFGIAIEVCNAWLGRSWLVHVALILALVVGINAVIRDFVRSDLIALVFRWIGLPLLILHSLNLLEPIVEILRSMNISIGNIEFSAFGFLRVALFGSLLFWLGRVSNRSGQEIIRRQQKLDIRTRELAAKLLEVAIFVAIFLLLLQVMGISITALAVFGGALGVGLGFGLQAIASNFISGIIILLDRSITVGDYIELEDGRSGVVRELTLRSTTLETYDGKDVMVPNEKFVAETFTNWTHKNKKQRYRVDFSVAYDSDIRQLVEIIKATVASHEQVISGDDVPVEERPDCEIDSFGDSGVNMFVEFWMIGIDDGKNRVGGDLLLMIFEAMRENGFVIPFPQREVRMLKGELEE